MTKKESTLVFSFFILKICEQMMKFNDFLTIVNMPLMFIKKSSSIMKSQKGEAVD